MFGQWQSGNWRSKPAHWLWVNIYLAVVVRAMEFTADSDWAVFVVFGNMEDTLVDGQSRPVRFPHSEVEAAKTAAIEHVRSATKELVAAVERIGIEESPETKARTFPDQMGTEPVPDWYEGEDEIPQSAETQRVLYEEKARQALR